MNEVIERSGRLWSQTLDGSWRCWNKRRAAWEPSGPPPPPEPAGSPTRRNVRAVAAGVVAAALAASALWAASPSSETVTVRTKSPSKTAAGPSFAAAASSACTAAGARRDALAPPRSPRALARFASESAASDAALADDLRRLSPPSPAAPHVERLIAKLDRSEVLWTRLARSAAGDRASAARFQLVRIDNLLRRRSAAAAAAGLPECAAA